MKKILLTVSVALTMSSSFAQGVSNKSPQPDQLGYSYGYVMGRSNADTLKDLNLDTFIQGLKQGASGGNSVLSDEDMAKTLSLYKKQSESRQLTQFQRIAAKNLAVGEAFLAENAKKSGVKTLASGLQYQVLKAGSGKSPTATSKVKVQYEGRLLDGTVFDSSIARNQPVEFQTSQVIAGWTEGLQLMKEGAEYRFFIPAKLAYGEMGSGDSIEPNSSLIFDVELLKVLP